MSNKQRQERVERYLHNRSIQYLLCDLNTDFHIAILSGKGLFKRRCHVCHQYYSVYAYNINAHCCRGRQTVEEYK